jgi:Zn-dependent protease with chaperone function
MKWSPLAIVLRLLTFLYFPYLSALCLFMGWILYHLGRWFLAMGVFGPLLIPFIGLLGMTLYQVFRSAWVLLSWPSLDDDSEMRIPRKKLQGLYELTTEVARQRRLPAPQEIRLAADTVAHVYEDDEGNNILVIGGIALRAFTQEALAGVIAHELGHFAAGDTRLGRRSARRLALMALLDERFSELGGTSLNPLVWLIQMYHGFYQLVRAAAARRAEYAADRHDAAQVGAALAAATLLRLTVTERLPWLRLSSIASACAATQQPLELIFEEQERRGRSITSTEWDEASHKELERVTGWYDSHPALRDRLAALGVTPQKALQLAFTQSGPPARDLVPEWKSIEKKMTELLMARAQEDHAAKRELAQIILGRPIDRP